jgi:hypothetical protein
MADILLQNSPVSTDQDSLDQIVKKMETAINDFVDLVKANIELFMGRTRGATVQQLQWLTDVSNHLSGDFSTGNQKLADMVHTINAADARAAGVMGG